MPETDKETSSRERSECAQFVADVSFKIGDLFDDAEVALHEIPFCSLILLRSCAKLVALELCCRRDIPGDVGQPFFEILDSCTFNNSVPKELCDEFHRHRIEGNRAAHPEDGKLGRAEAFELAKAGLKSLYQIVAQDLARGDEDPPKFKLPDKSSSNRLCGDAVLRDNAQAQFGLGMLKKRNADAEFEARIEAVRKEGGGYVGGTELAHLFKVSYYWFEQAARQDRYPQALYEMAQIQITGRFSGYEVDRGLALLYQADELKVVDAAATLGLYALTGEVFDSTGRVVAPFDEDESARERLEYAANHGHPAALNGLMSMYLHGNEVEENHARALEYAQAAADMGFPVAKLNLARLYIGGIGEPREAGETVELLEHAAEAGMQEAYVYLYQVYDEGIGVEADPERAEQALETGFNAMEPYALVTWSRKSIAEDGPHRELRKELYSLLRVIDKEDTPADLREAAEGLLECTLEAMRSDYIQGLSHIGEMSEERADELEKRLMDLGIGTADLDLSQSVSPDIGIAQHRPLHGFKCQAACVLLFAQDSSTQDRKEAIEILEDVVPEFDWASLRPESGVNRSSKAIAPSFVGRSKPFRNPGPEIGRNDRCRCGSGKKYKRCCAQ